MGEGDEYDDQIVGGLLGFHTDIILNMQKYELSDFFSLTEKIFYKLFLFVT